MLAPFVMGLVGRPNSAYLKCLVSLAVSNSFDKPSRFTTFASVQLASVRVYGRLKNIQTPLRYCLRRGRVKPNKVCTLTGFRGDLEGFGKKTISMRCKTLQNKN